MKILSDRGINDTHLHKLIVERIFPIPAGYLINYSRSINLSMRVEENRAYVIVYFTKIGLPELGEVEVLNKKYSEMLGNLFIVFMRDNFDQHSYQLVMKNVISESLWKRIR